MYEWRTANVVAMVSTSLVRPDCPWYVQAWYMQIMHDKARTVMCIDMASNIELEMRGIKDKESMVKGLVNVTGGLQDAIFLKGMIL